MADQTPSIQTYAELLASIKERIRNAPIRASLAVNRELVLLNWGIDHSPPEAGGMGEEGHRESSS